MIKINEVKFLKTNQLKLNNEKYQVWGPTLQEKYKQLLDDIKKNGIRDLIHVDENYTVLDGHYRYKVATTLGIEEVFVKIYYGLTEDEKLGIAYKNNAMKKDITRKEKVEKAIVLRKEGRSYRQIGEWLGVHNTTVREWVIKFPVLKIPHLPRSKARTAANIL